MNIYFISGLGADQRAFDKLKLPSECEIHHVHWIDPKKAEKINEYAKRLLAQIDLNKPFSLVGLSFGGMMAIEVAKLTHPNKVVIISSVANCNQLPWHYKTMGRLKVYDYLPLKLMKRKSVITNWFFGTKNEHEQQLLADTIAETDSNYLKWALKMISTWNNKTKIPNLTQIHGENDRLFPLKFVKPDIIIKNGSHLMVKDQADEMSKLLATILVNK